MPTLNVTKSLDATLRVNYSGGVVGFRVVYDSGREFPMAGIYVSQVGWGKLVAWVELQRKEEALQEAQQKKR